MPARTPRMLRLTVRDSQSMSLILAILIDGFIYASWLFVVAAGLTLIYGVMRVLNMCHGSFYAIGAYTSASLVGWYFEQGLPEFGSFAAMALAAVLAGGIAGLITERGVLRFLHGRDEVVMVLVTFGLLLVFEDLIVMLWGVQSYYAYQPYGLLGSTDFGNLSFVNYDRDRRGWRGGRGSSGISTAPIRASCCARYHDREGAVAMGINVSRLFVITSLSAPGWARWPAAWSRPPSPSTRAWESRSSCWLAVVATGGLGSTRVRRAPS